MSESIGSDAAQTVRSEAPALGEHAEDSVENSPSFGAESSLAGSGMGAGLSQPESVVVAPSAPVPERQNGFQAFLQHANLHNLLQIEGMSRTSGVFLVVSEGRRGYLHLSNGDLVHAEAGALGPEAAAAEILSWGQGEFSSCDRTLAPVRTIQATMPALLLRLAKAQDEAAHLSERQGAVSERQGAVSERQGAQASHERVQAVEQGVPPRSNTLGGLAPGVLGPGSIPGPGTPLPPRLSRLPPSSVSRSEPDSGSLTEVQLSATGEIMSGRGPGLEEFSARVAYAARLADLIGRAIRSGTPRALELRGKATQTSVRWQEDGKLSATLDLALGGVREQGNRSK